MVIKSVNSESENNSVEQQELNPDNGVGEVGVGVVVTVGDCRCGS